MEKPKYKWDMSEASPAEVEGVLREDAWRIFQGALKGILKLDDEAREIVLKEMAKSCAGFCMERFKFEGKGEMDVDVFISEMNMAGPERRDIKRVGDTIFWEACVGDYGKGCMCVLVGLGLVEPTPDLCKCGTNWVKYIVEKETGRQVEAELVDSPNTGGDHDHWRLHLKPSVYTSKAGQ